MTIKNLNWLHLKVAESQKAFIKFRYYEKATKFEKNLPPVLTKQLFLLSSVKTSGRFFQIFVAFSEKLDFTQSFVFLWRTVIYISWKIISLLNPVKRYHLERGSGPHFKSITGWGLRSEAKIGSGELDIMGLTPDLIGTWGIPEARRPIDRHISTKTNKGVKTLAGKYTVLQMFRQIYLFMM